MTKTVHRPKAVRKSPARKKPFSDRFRAARLRAQDAYFRKHYRIALRLYTALAIKRDPIAQLKLVEMYRMGQGSSVNADRSSYWLQRVTAQAEGGCADARWALHEYYLFDKELGIPVHEPALNPWSGIARQWLIAAADAGHPEGMFEMAMRYEYGFDGFRKNLRKARYWLLKSVAAQHPYALVYRAFAYFRNGRPTKRAIPLLTAAAKLGEADAADYLELAGVRPRSLRRLDPRSA